MKNSELKSSYANINAFLIIWSYDFGTLVMVNSFSAPLHQRNEVGPISRKGAHFRMQISTTLNAQNDESFTIEEIRRVKIQVDHFVNTRFCFINVHILQPSMK